MKKIVTLGTKYKLVCLFLKLSKKENGEFYLKKVKEHKTYDEYKRNFLKITNTNDFVSNNRYKESQITKKEQVKIDGLSEEEEMIVLDWYNKANELVDKNIITESDFTNEAKLIEKINEYYN